MTATVPGILLTGDHASLPAASAVESGAVYACSTHLKLYQSDGSSWTDWYDPTSLAGGALGAWTDYTPTLTATTTNPTLGSSTLTGRYKALDSKTYIVQVQMLITTGGAWNPGSGEWKFSLPAGLTTHAARNQAAGSIHVLDSGTARFSGTAMLTAGSTDIHPMVIADSTADRVLKHNNPVTWATGDQIQVSVTIEVA